MLLFTIHDQFFLYVDYSLSRHEQLLYFCGMAGKNMFVSFTVFLFCTVVCILQCSCLVEYIFLRMETVMFISAIPVYCLKYIIGLLTFGELNTHSGNPILNHWNY